MALNRAEANERYFEIPAALSFVIAPLFCTVKRITEVTSLKGHGKDIIIDIVNVNDIVKVIANYMLPMTLLFTLVILKIFCKGENFQLLILLKIFKIFFC